MTQILQITMLGGYLIESQKRRNLMNQHWFVKSKHHQSQCNMYLELVCKHIEMKMQQLMNMILKIMISVYFCYMIIRPQHNFGVKILKTLIMRNKILKRFIQKKLNIDGHQLKSFGILIRFMSSDLMHLDTQISENLKNGLGNK